MGTRQAIALGSAALGALAVLNSALSATPQQPEPATPGPSIRYRWAEGSIHYTVHGTGSPLLLLHGIGITNSSYEMRYIAEPLARTFRVFVPDLLGYGRSDRPRRHYTPALYRGLIAALLREVVGPGAAVLASGLTAAYLVAVAAEHPRLVGPLILSAPVPPAAVHTMRVRTRRAAAVLLETPVLGQTLFNSMTTKGGIRTYLREQVYANADLVTESMVEAHFATAHQPNARNAPYAYLSGKLDLDSAADFARLQGRLLLAFGAQASQSPAADAAVFARLNPHAEVLILDRSGSLPHEEQAEAFATAAESWLGGAPD